MTLEELLNANPRPSKITIQQAAKIMGVTPRFLQIALRQGRFPFGVGTEMDRAWSYYINTSRFIKYMTGEEITYYNHRPFSAEIC